MTDSSTAIKLDSVSIGGETSEAISGLADYEQLFIINKAKSDVRYNVFRSLSDWMQVELEKNDCDMGRVARFATAVRLLNKLIESEHKYFPQPRESENK